MMRLVFLVCVRVGRVAPAYILKAWILTAMMPGYSMTVDLFQVEKLQRVLKLRSS